MSGYVNTATGKIVGVKEGTREYYHEVGHLVYANSFNGIRNHNLQQFIFNMIFPFIIGGVIFFQWRMELGIIAAVLYIAYQTFDIIEEKWCWKYADRRMNES